MNNNSYKLIGGFVLCNENCSSRFFPGMLRLVFEKQNRFYIQESVRGLHPYTYTNNVEYVEVNDFNINDVKNKSNNRFLKINDNILSENNVDRSKYIHGLALSENNYIINNLDLFSEKLSSLKMKDQYIDDAKKHYETMSKDCKAHGYFFRDDAIREYITGESMVKTKTKR